MYNSLIAGVDIGGSHITVALIDPVKREILEGSVQRSRIDSGSDTETILNGWYNIIRNSYTAFHAKPQRIGIAMPGPFDYEAGISLLKEQGKYASLYGINVKEWLAERLDIKEQNIIFSNDASCFLQGEVYNGAVKGKKKVVGLTLGTGLGSSTFTDENAVDADMWHHAFKDGIAEDYLSSRWFIKRYAELSGKKIADVKSLVESYQLEKDSKISQVFNEFGTNLALFLSPLLRSKEIYDVVLGGNISQAFELFHDALHKKIREEDLKVNIRQTILWEKASLLGAASFCQNQTNQFRQAQLSKNIS